MVLCVLLGLSFSFLVVSFSISDWARLALKQLVSVSSEMLLIFQVSKFGANGILLATNKLDPILP